MASRYTPSCPKLRLYSFVRKTVCSRCFTSSSVKSLYIFPDSINSLISIKSRFQFPLRYGKNHSNFHPLRRIRRKKDFLLPERSIGHIRGRRHAILLLHRTEAKRMAFGIEQGNRSVEILHLRFFSPTFQSV